MKLLLIQPPVQDFYDTDVRLQPIGLCYLKAAIKRHLPNVEVVIKDYHAGHGRRTVTIPKELRYLSEYYPVADKSPFSTFHRYYHFGKPLDKSDRDSGNEARRRRYLVTVHALLSRSARSRRIVLKRHLNIPVVMGGSHASALPDSLISSPAVDYVIRGEGEKPLVSLLRYMAGEITSRRCQI